MLRIPGILDDRDEEQIALDETEALMERRIAGEPEPAVEPLAAGDPEVIPEEATPEEAIDPRLQAAMEDRDQKQLMANLLRTFQTGIAAGAAGTGYKADMSVADQIDKQSGQSVKDYKSQLSAEKDKKAEARQSKKDEMAKLQHEQAMELGKINIAGKQLEITNLQKTSDPGSDESAFARQEYIKLRQQAGDPVGPDEMAKLEGMSGKDLVERTPALQDKVKQLLTFKRQDQLKAEERKYQEGKTSENREFQEKQATTAHERAMEKERLKLEEKQKTEDRKTSAEDKKERTKIATENRKEVKKIDNTMKKLDDMEADLKNAIKLQKSYSKSSIGGTGPLATLGGTKTVFSQDLQQLEEALQKVSLTNMGKMFEGMSKAIDSDAERQKFEASQANIEKDDKVNLANLERQLIMLKELKKKNRIAKEDYNKNNTAEKVKRQQTSELSQANGDLQLDEQDYAAMEWAMANPEDPRSQGIIDKLKAKGMGQ